MFQPRRGEREDGVFFLGEENDSVGLNEVKQGLVYLFRGPTGTRGEVAEFEVTTETKKREIPEDLIDIERDRSEGQGGYLKM